MQFPVAFNTSSRQALSEALKACHLISLHSFELSELVTSSDGAVLLGKGIADGSRTQRPGDWNALVCWAVGNDAQQLSSALQSVNLLCPLRPFVEAQRIAKSKTTLETDKFQLPAETAQSIEWAPMSSILTLPALASAYQDASTSLLLEEGQQLISNIDTELAELEQKKAQRDTALANAQFQSGEHGLNTQYFAASSDTQLANNISNLGSQEAYWVYCCFVGSGESLRPVKELFGA